MADDSQRRCVGCNDSFEPEQLERFVYMDGMGLIFDARKKAPGRGAWVCPKDSCLRAALERGFNRSFKSRLELPGFDDLKEDVVDGIRQRLVEGLRVAVRSKSGFVGSRAVDEGMQSGKVRLLLVASDAGDATDKKYRSNADRKDVPTIDRFDGAFLAGATGKDFVSVFGVGGSIASRIQSDIQSLETLGVFEG